MPLTTDEKRQKIAGVLYTKGANALKANQLDYAIDCYLQCVKLDPTKLDYRQALRGVEYEKYNDNGKGASGAGLRSSGARMSLKIAKARKKWVDVIESAEDILVLNPWDVDVLLEICNACKEIGECEPLGYWVAQTAAKSNKERPDAFRMLAYFAEARQMFNEAIVALEQVKKLDPSDAETPMKIRQLAASSTIKRGHYEGEEAEEGEKAEGEEGQDAPKKEKASPVIRPAAPPPETPEGKANREIKEMEDKIAAEPKNPLLYAQLGNAYQAIGDLDSAVKAFGRGYKACDNDIDLRFRFLEIRIDQFKTNEAEGNVALEKAQKAGDKDRAKAVEKQIEQVIRGRLKAEVEMGQIRIKFKPDDHGAWLDVGIGQYELREYDEAIKSLQRGRADMRRKWEALMYLGLCFWQKRNFTFALKNLADAQPLVPTRDEVAKKEVYYWRGRVAKDAGERELAIEMLNEVAAIDYGYKDVSDLLDELNRPE